MVDHFLGQHVSVILHTKLHLEGTISQVDPVRQSMRLENVCLYNPGFPKNFTELYIVQGKDIDDLQIIEPSVASSNNTSAQSNGDLGNQSISERTSSASQNHTERQKQHQNMTKNTNNQGPFVSTSTNTKKSNHQSNSWVHEDVSGLNDDYDFQANLKKFDKTKVMNEIGNSDMTKTSDRLVSHNRLPRTNLLPTENVLDSSDQFEDGNESDIESTTDDRRGYQEMVKTQPPPAELVFKTRPSTNCPVVSSLDLAHAEHEYNVMTGMPRFVEEIVTENAGRELCRLAVDKIGSEEAKIVVLAGCRRIGAFGIAAARHLANRHHQVTVCLSSKGQKCETLKRQLDTARGMSSFKVVHNTKDLDPNTDLVIDAVLGSQDRLDDMQEEKPAFDMMCKMMQWAGRQNAPILSVDFPSGANPQTGKPSNALKLWVQPRWTLCLGAPLSGCTSRQVTGEVYVADIGIPNQCWERAGVKKWKPIWAAESLVALDYKVAGGVSVQ